MKALLRSAVAAAAAGAGCGVAAKEIPIELGWSGTQPSSVNISTAGGLQPLEYDAQRRVYRGTASVAGSAPERRTIIVSYGTFNHPIDLRLHSVLPAVTFSVDHAAHGSCTQTKVTSVGQQSTNLRDAISRTVGAGQLLSIEKPNDCDRTLRLHAARARYRQNVQMMQHSNGLFIINEQIKDDYYQLAGLDTQAVSAEINAYAAAEAQLEAVQLTAARNAAQQASDFAAAAEINAYMEDRLSNDADARAAFAEAGITRTRVQADSRFLDAMAAQMRLRNQ